MALPQILIDVLGQIDADLNAVAAVIRSLRDQISTSLPPAEVVALKGKLDEVAARLEGIAADPANPLPPGPPLTP